MKVKGRRLRNRNILDHLRQSNIESYWNAQLSHVVLRLSRILAWKTHPTVERSSQQFELHFTWNLLTGFPRMDWLAKRGSTVRTLENTGTRALQRIPAVLVP
jgi:hypothetical protein